MSKEEVMSKVKVGEKLPETKATQPNLHYYLVESIIVRNLTGEILTIIDSSIIEERQNKAVKDLVKSRIKYWMNNIQSSASKRDSDNGLGRWGHSINIPK